MSSLNWDTPTGWNWRQLLRTPSLPSPMLNNQLCYDPLCLTSLKVMALCSQPGFSFHPLIPGIYFFSFWYLDLSFSLLLGRSPEPRFQVMWNCLLHSRLNKKEPNSCLIIWLMLWWPKRKTGEVDLSHLHEDDILHINVKISNFSSSL